MSATQATVTSTQVTVIYRQNVSSLSIDMSADNRTTALGRHIDRYIGRVLVEISTDMSVDMSTDTSRSIYRPSVGRYDGQGKLVRICFFGTSEFTLQIVMEKRRGRQEMDPENGNNPFPQIATGLPRGIILKPDQTGLGLYPVFNLVPGVFLPSLPLGWGDERPWERCCPVFR